MATTTTKRRPRKQLAAQREDTGIAETISRNVRDAGKSALEVMPDTHHMVEQLQQQLEDARTKIRELTSRVNDAAHAARSNASAALSSASETLSSTAATVADKATAVAHTAAHRADMASSDVERFSRRNPIGALSAAVALGVLIGLATRRKR